MPNILGSTFTAQSHVQTFGFDFGLRIEADILTSAEAMARMWKPGTVLES